MTPVYFLRMNAEGRRTGRTALCVAVWALVFASCSGPRTPPRDDDIEGFSAPEPLEQGNSAEIALDWQARYRHHRERLAGTFEALRVPRPYRLQLKNGSSRDGRLVAVRADAIDLEIESGVITYGRDRLSAAVRAQLFEEDYLQAEAMRAVREERAAHRQKVAAAAAAERIAAARLSAPPAEPPVPETVADGAPRLSERPANDPADSSVWQVKEHLKRTLMDPDSIEYISWSPVMDSGDEFRVVCSYRAQAGSFGMVTEKKVFFMDREGRVTAVSAVRPDIVVQ